MFLSKIIKLLKENKQYFSVPKSISLKKINVFGYPIAKHTKYDKSMKQVWKNMNKIWTYFEKVWISAESYF